MNTNDRYTKNTVAESEQDVLRREDHQKKRNNKSGWFFLAELFTGIIQLLVG